VAGDGHPDPADVHHPDTAAKIAARASRGPAMAPGDEISQLHERFSSISGPSRC